MARRISDDFSNPGLKAALNDRARTRRQLAATTRLPDHKNMKVRNDLLPHLKLENRAVSELRQPTRKVRRANEKHIKSIARSIERFGVCDAILITAAGEIIDGVIIYLAAMSLGMTEIPCIIIDHLSDAQVKALRIAINRTGEQGEWDLQELQYAFEELIELDESLDDLGFGLGEIDQVLLDNDDVTDSTDDELPELEPESMPVSRTGDLWTLDEHRVLCADATDPDAYKRLMQDFRARCVMSDPPYNVRIPGHVSGLGGRQHSDFLMASGEMSDAEFENFLKAFLAAAIPHLVDGALVMAFIDWRGLVKLTRAASEVGLDQINLIVWNKSNPGMGSLYRSQHELIPLFKHGKAPHTNNVELGRSGRSRSNVWDYAGASTMGSDAREGLSLHPTVKPVAMLADAVLDITSRGEIVLDPFLGSGSTLIAAERTGRVCFGMELDPRYVDVILQRWIKLGGSEPILESTGQTFTEVAIERSACISDAATSGPEILPAPPGQPAAPIVIKRKAINIRPGR